MVILTIWAVKKCFKWRIGLISVCMIYNASNYFLSRWVVYWLLFIFSSHFRLDLTQHPRKRKNTFLASGIIHETKKLEMYFPMHFIQDQFRSEGCVLEYMCVCVCECMCVSLCRGVCVCVSLQEDWPSPEVDQTATEEASVAFCSSWRIPATAAQ